MVHDLSNKLDIVSRSMGGAVLRTLAAAKVRLRQRPMATLLEALLAVGLVALAGTPLLRFFGIAWARLRYPFELEWMEGGVVDHVRVVLAGRSLYGPPSLDFTPFIYTPGYYYVSALVTKLVGLGFFAPRLVSLLSVAACFVLIAWWVYRETQVAVAGVVAAGLFAATYGESGYWFDVARVDSLFLALLLGGTVLARWGKGTAASLVAGAVLAAAVMTKQVGALLVVPALLYRYRVGWLKGVWTSASFLWIGGGAVLLLELVSKGWFSFYTWRMPAGHLVEWERLPAELRTHATMVLVPLGLASLAVLSGWVRPRCWAAWGLLASLLVLAAGTSLSALLHTGGYVNTLMPIHAAMALCAGLSFARVWQAAGAELLTQTGARLFALAVVWLQLELLSWAPRQDLVPSEADAAAGREMLATIGRTQGPIWMVASGYYPYVVSGAPVTAHGVAMADIFKSRQEGVKRRLRAQLSEAISSRRYQTIVLDRAVGFLPDDVGEEIRRHYLLKSFVFNVRDGRFWPKVGATIRPAELWVPRPVPPPPVASPPAAHPPALPNAGVGHSLRR
jgi:hypothetical protein